MVCWDLIIINNKVDSGFSEHSSLFNYYNFVVEHIFRIELHK